MVANGGAPSVDARVPVGVTTWQAWHQRSARRLPLSASAAIPGRGRSAIAKIMEEPMRRKLNAEFIEAPSA
jgi:hypothetical protein